MKKYNCDFHIHIGSSKGKAVKVTASRNLTIENIINQCIYVKGMEIIGLVDCASPHVLQNLSEMINSGELYELTEGGLSFQNKLTIILGSEVETTEGVHVVCYFKDMSKMIAFSEIMSEKITNITLSTQRAKITSLELLKIVEELDGIFMPAHIFTPHKSYYGKAFNRLKECFGDKTSSIKVVELGLSSDSYLADSISELHSFNFLTNSDAHSKEKIGREFNVLVLGGKNFNEVKKAFYGLEGRQIVANYGLDPRLGKYYYSFCPKCNVLVEEKREKCEICGSKKIIKGVINRIKELADMDFGIHPPHRPQYHHQIPLEFIPKIGKKTREKLLQEFGFELDILHHIDEEKLKKCLDFDIIDTILKGREGSLNLQKGGGGHYGKILR